MTLEKQMNIIRHTPIAPDGIIVLPGLIAPEMSDVEALRAAGVDPACGAVETRNADGSMFVRFPAMEV